MLENNQTNNQTNRKRHQRPSKTKNYTVDEIGKKYSEIYKKYGDKKGLDLINTFINSPYIQNERINSLSTRPYFRDREEIEKALKSPSNYDRELRSTSWSLLSNTYPYYKMIKLYSDILTYNYYTFPRNIKSKEEFSSDKFKKEEKLVNSFIDAIKPQYTFRRIAMESCIEGKRAYILRSNFNKNQSTVDYAILQALPSDWWKITSKTQDSYYGISFNFAYFWQPGTDISQFPPIFQQFYDEIKGCFQIDRSKGRLRPIKGSKMPSNLILEYSKDQYYMWMDMPSNLVWCFSVDESNGWQVPPFIGLFLSLQDLNSYQYLQSQLASIPLYGVITGEVPFNEKNKSGSHINDFAISPEVYIGEEYRANAVFPPGISALYTPIKNMKLHQFQEQVNSSKIYTDAMQQTIATAGLTGLQSTTDKPTIAMIKASEKIETRFIDFMYRQFEHFMEVVFEDILVLDYDWKFEMFGSVFTIDDEKNDLANKISTGHSYLLPRFLACYNLNLRNANIICDYIDDSGIYDKLKTPPSAYQSSGEQSNGPGRAEIDDDDVDNDNTALSKESGTNKIENRAYN